jgi:hypothetical protein
MSREAYAFIIGTALVVFSVFFLARLLAPEPEIPPESSIAPGVAAPAALNGEEVRIVVADQEPGERFLIDAIRTDRASWVVVFPARNEEQKPFGAFFFPPYDGIQSGGGALWRPLVSGEYYRAVLHEDDGDNSFHLEQDPPLLDGAGLPMQTEFFVR